MEIGLTWVHMARYGLILRLDGALWLTIISKPLTIIYEPLLSDMYISNTPPRWINS